MRERRRRHVRSFSNLRLKELRPLKILLMMILIWPQLANATEPIMVVETVGGQSSHYPIEEITIWSEGESADDPAAVALLPTFVRAGGQ
jgi:hypothetical protein